MTASRGDLEVGQGFRADALELQDVFLDVEVLDAVDAPANDVEQEVSAPAPPRITSLPLRPVIRSLPSPPST